jgi:hypothetical protein
VRNSHNLLELAVRNRRQFASPRTCASASDVVLGRMERLGHLFNVSQSKASFSATHVLIDVCAHRPPEQFGSRAVLQTMLIETVVMWQGALPELLANGLWSVFNAQLRAVSALDVQWLTYGLRRTARATQIPTQSADNCDTRDWHSHESGFYERPANQLELLCNVAAAAANTTTISPSLRTVIFDTMVAVLQDSRVAASAKETAADSLLCFSQPLPDQVVHAAVRAAPVSLLWSLPLAVRVSQEVPVEALSWDATARRAILSAAVEAVVACIRRRIEDRFHGREGYFEDLVSLVTDADEEGCAPWQDCWRIAMHHAWLGDAHAHVTIRSPCESERVVWTLYSAALSLSGGGAADLVYVDLAMMDDSPFVRAAAFAGFRHLDRTTPCGVARLLREVIVQCQRVGLLESWLLHDQLYSVATDSEILSEMGTWGPAEGRTWPMNRDDSAARALCLRLFDNVCGLAAAGATSDVPVDKAARAALRSLLKWCPFVTGDVTRGLTLWCNAYRILMSFEGPSAENLVALCKGSENLSLHSLSEAPPDEIASVTEFAVRAAKSSVIFGTKLNYLARLEMRAAAKLLPVSSAPQVLDGLMPGALAFPGEFDVARLKHRHLIVQRPRRGAIHTPSLRKTEDRDCMLQVVQAIAQRWSLDAPERLRECVYDLFKLPCFRRCDAMDEDTPSDLALHVRAELHEIATSVMCRLLLANQTGDTAGHLLRWLRGNMPHENANLPHETMAHKQNEFIAILAAHMGRVSDARRLLGRFGDFLPMASMIKGTIMALFSKHDDWKCESGGSTLSTANASQHGKRDDRERCKQLLAAMSTVLSPLAELCYRFGDTLIPASRNPRRPPLAFAKLDWLHASPANVELVDRVRGRLALLAACATLEWNANNDPTPGQHVFTIDLCGEETAVITHQHRLQWMDQFAAVVLHSLPRRDDQGAAECHIPSETPSSQDVGDGKAMASSLDDLTDLDDLLAPLTLEFCTSLRTLLMRDIASFTPASSDGVAFPTHLALLLLELHRHPVFARGALHTSAMVDECTDCFARVQERVPPEVASTLRSLQASVRRRSRSMALAQGEPLEGEPALRKSARQEPRESCEETVKLSAVQHRST